MKLDDKRETFTIYCAIRSRRTQIERCDALRAKEPGRCPGRLQVVGWHLLRGFIRGRFQLYPQFR